MSMVVVDRDVRDDVPSGSSSESLSHQHVSSGGLVEVSSLSWVNVVWLFF